MDRERAGMPGSLGRGDGASSPGLEGHVVQPHRYHCLHAPPSHTGRRMIRRHALWFRALLIAADALVAVGLLVVLSALAIRPGLGELVARDRSPAPGLPRAVRGDLGRRPDAERPLSAARAMDAPQRGGRGRPRNRRSWRWSR